MNDLHRDWPLDSWMELCPRTDWNQFSESKNLAHLIWDSLPLRDNGGVWAHLSFSSTQSIWEADDYKDGSQVLVDFDSSEDDARVVRVLVRLRASETSSFSQLLVLLDVLKTRYGIACKGPAS